MTRRVARGSPRYPGRRVAQSGEDAVRAVEALACRDDAGAGPHAAVGRRRTWSIDEAAGAGLSGLRASVMTGGPALASMHDALFAAVGKRLTTVVGVASRAMTKQAVSAAAGHDDYHAVSDTGVFQFFAADVQSAADLTLIAHRAAELALNPGLVAQDALSTSGTVATLSLPEPDLIAEYLGDPSDAIESPTPAQQLVFGASRRRVPKLFDLDYPAMLGAVEGPDSYAQGVAAQRPFYFDHVAGLIDRAMAEFEALTGRAYARVRGHRLDDATMVLVAQGALVRVCEAVCDHVRATSRVRLGVLDLTTFRPFPADLVVELLAGRQAVTVLERVDQPLAADPPLLREIRGAVAAATDRGRKPAQAPAFHSGCVGLGRADVSAADVLAAVENMEAGKDARRQFYLGVDFARPGTRLPKLQVWQEQVADAYPDLAALALPAGTPLDLVPATSLSLKVHATPAPGASSFGLWSARVVGGATGQCVQAMPESGRGASGRVAVTHVTVSAAPLRVSGAPHPAAVVFVADPRTAPVLDPADSLADGGALLVDAPGSPDEAWRRLPSGVRQHLLRKQARVHVIDAGRVAREAGGTLPPVLARDVVRLGALVKVSDLASRAGQAADAMLEAIGREIARDHGPDVLERCVAVVRSGYDAVATPAAGAMEAGTMAPAAPVPITPRSLGRAGVQAGIGHSGRFWERVGALQVLGESGLADPFAATGAIPAATSVIRDMTPSRLTVPAFIADRCTGCGNCWVQCPDNAIPGVVSDVAEILNAALEMVEADRPCDRLRQVVKPLANETRRMVKAGPLAAFGDVLAAAYDTVAAKLGLDDARRSELDGEFAAVRAALTDFPLAKTEPFFDEPEKRAKGTGGLLSVTVNPEACKGCGTCVSMCPEGALVQVEQTDEVVDRLRRNWRLWRYLPETDDRYVVNGDGGPLSTLLLKQPIYQSVSSGDSAMPGAPEKTVMHLVLSAVNATVLPRVKQHVSRLDELLNLLDAKARGLLASDARLEDVASLPTTPDGRLAIALETSKHERVQWLATVIRELKDLRWRYVEGPAGRGRATCGMAQAADDVASPTSTYPFNPYPFPWVSHLLQDAPSIAVGLFEGQMRQMARGFAWVRRAELEVRDEYDAASDEPALAALTWREFTDDEFALCPPMLAVGSHDAMVEAGFQHLSHLLTSDRPVRVVVLDTLADDDPAARRQDLAWLAVAHRRAFVLQSSTATSSHLLSGVLRGLQSRAPAVFVVHCPRVADDGAGQAGSVRAARLALESRAFPVLVYDPAAGPSAAERLDLEGNPALDETWPSYELAFKDETGAGQTMTLPVTVADWAAAEAGLASGFRPVDGETGTVMRFDEYLAADRDVRAEATPFIFAVDVDGRLVRLAVDARIVALAEDRLDAWRQLRQMAGLEVADRVAKRVTAPVEARHQRQLQTLHAEQQAVLHEMHTTYPTRIARRLVEGLMRAAGDGSETVADFLRRATTAAIQPLPSVDGDGDAPPPLRTDATPAAPSVDVAAAPAAPVPAPATVDVDADDDDDLVMEAYVQSALCTSCDECININKRMFAYNKQKQAYIKDATAGTYRQLVLAAQKCPVSIIHPGTPLNPDEKDLDKWVEAAAQFR